MFEPAFYQKCGIKAAQLLRRFDSKNNKVALFSFLKEENREESWIVKKYQDPDRCQKEAEILGVLDTAGLAVPKIMYIAADYLVLEYLEGVTFLEWLENAEKAGWAREQYLACLHDFAHWFKAFYRVSAENFSPGLIFGDVNLRNFLLGEQFYGLDFEDCRPGLPAEDLGCFCAYILTYDPAFTWWKYQFVAAVKEEVLPKLGLDWRPVFCELQKELERMSRRRKRKNLPAELRRHSGFDLIL